MKKIITITQFFIFFIISVNLNAQTFNEILGRPTNNSITMTILFDQKTDVYWEYGTVSGSYNNITTTYIAQKDTTLKVDFINLTPNTKYYYRTRYRLNGTSGVFSTNNEHSFYTQRAIGSSFTFTIESDVHLYDKKGVLNEYKICLANQASDKPDFMIDMGDTYGDDHYPTTITSGKLDTLHKAYRPLLGNICHSIPYFFCLGNHEGEFNYYYNQNPPNNLAVMGTLWRKFYYANPFPNSFYSGNNDNEPYGIGKPENYYAFTWGNALFVVLDVYRYQCDTSAKPQKWDWSLGSTQYNWLKTTLENSNSQYKFVFAHHVSGQGRGGAVQARFYEWGGFEQNGIDSTFATKRPGWAKPIHRLFVDNGVNIFFQGHDHVFAREFLNGVIYQSMPMPSDSTYQIGMLANAAAYLSDTIAGSGHLRVNVTPECVKVDFVRAYLPADTLSGVHHNGEVAFSYTIGTCSNVDVNNIKAEESVKVFPNPAKDKITLILSKNFKNYKINLFNAYGQLILETQSKEIDVSKLPNGLYFINIRLENSEINKKIVINH
ncbi:MAG: T9SS type A sorting domain-containing protein [Bacteroidales bacterium]